MGSGARQLMDLQFMVERCPRQIDNTFFDRFRVGLLFQR